jgi:hypothetical protein
VKKQTWKDDEERTKLLENPQLWAEESQDDDDIFMTSNKGKRTASSKGKNAASSSSKGWRADSLKGKGNASLKDDDFM